MIMIGTRKIKQTFVLPDTYAGQRLDHALALHQSDYSRACWQRWLKEGMVKTDDILQTGKYKLKGGETISVEATLAVEAPWQPQALDINIVHEDEALLIINKPANCVVHPAIGNRDGTLANALLHYLPEQASLPRAGLIHRLDKDTTGLLVVAKTLTAYNWLVKELEKRLVKRHYLALVNGHVSIADKIEAPLGRHPGHRIKRAVVESGKHACTHYQPIKYFAKHTLLAIQLETGRTHQIRVHMKYIGYPIVGDKLYDSGTIFPRAPTEAVCEKLSNFKRQALHARRLGFIHPTTKEPVAWTCPLPEDFQDLIDVLSDFDAGQA